MSRVKGDALMIDISTKASARVIEVCCHVIYLQSQTIRIDFASTAFYLPQV